MVLSDDAVAVVVVRVKSVVVLHRLRQRTKYYHPVNNAMHLQVLYVYYYHFQSVEIEETMTTIN